MINCLSLSGIKDGSIHFPYSSKHQLALACVKVHEVLLSVCGRQTLF
jgi:hypothetical protein